MALIGTIRKNGWILIVTMVLALGGFILMDIISNSQRYQAGDANALGKVNGQSISYPAFEKYRSLVYANTPTEQTYQVRQSIWDYFVNRELVQKAGEDAGLGVGKDELRNLQFSVNPSEISQIIQTRFGNSSQGQQQLMYAKNAIETGNFDYSRPELRQFWEYWAEQEKEIIKDRVQNKLANMVTKGIYSPLWLSEMTFREYNERVTFNYVRLPFSIVPETDATVTDDDYKAYLKENPRAYFQEQETRNLSYVTFDVVPTAADTVNARNTLLALREGLRTAPNDSTFALANGGTFDGMFLKKSELPAKAADSLMQRPVGAVVGPYLDGDVWTMAKIVGRKAVPDSVKARHILIRDPGAEGRVDSLIGLLNSGKARFDSLAARFGTDGTAARGGDLGYFAQGTMVPEFNKLCFEQGEQGKIYKVRTQFGVHVMEITGKKFLTNETSVKAAFLRQRVEPGKSTQQDAKDKAVALSQQAKTTADLQNAGGDKVRVANGLKAVDFSITDLGQGDDIREIMRWAFNKDTKVDAVSKQVFVIRDPVSGFFDSKYVVPVLQAILPAGEASVASLRATPAADLLVRNRKKGEVLKAKIGTVSDLSALASQYNALVDTATNVTIAQTFLKNGGVEPRVYAAAFSIAKDAISAPIVGANGVYVVKPLTERRMPQGQGDYRFSSPQVVSSARNNFFMNFISSLRKKANISDTRERFF